MTIEIKAAAFDLEGTIVDVEQMHYQGLVKAAQAAGLRISREELISQPLR